MELKVSNEVSEKKRAEHRARLVTFLQKIPLFSELPTSSLRMILTICSKVTLLKDDVLCKECEDSNAMYILLSGKLIVSVGDSPPIATIEPVSPIGEMGVFTGEPRSATVMAIQKSSLLCLKKSELNVLIRKDPEFGVKIMSNVIKILSERIAADNVRIREFQNYIISQEKVQQANRIAEEIPEDEKKWGGDA